MSRPARAASFTAVALAGALALAACGSDEYRYVSNSSEKAFFRLPSNYQVFRVERSAPGDTTGRPSPVTSAGVTDPWHIAFDAGPSPTVDNASKLDAADPVGQALILPLSTGEADSASMKQARSVFLSNDPLDLAQNDPTKAEVVSATPVQRNGLHGTRVVVNLKTGNGWSTFDQTALLNAANDKMYLFEVHCTSACYQSNRSAIEQIVQSWQVSP